MMEFTRAPFGAAANIMGVPRPRDMPDRDNWVTELGARSGRSAVLATLDTPRYVLPRTERGKHE